MIYALGRGISPGRAPVSRASFRAQLCQMARDSGRNDLLEAVKGCPESLQFRFKAATQLARAGRFDAAIAVIKRCPGVPKPKLAKTIKAPKRERHLQLPVIA